MIRRGRISGFRKFQSLEFDLQERAVIAGPNNSGKTIFLQAIATWAELGEIWLEGSADLTRKTDGSFHRVEINIASFRTLALSSFDELWHNQATRQPMSIQVATDCWDVGFDLQYVDPTVATVGPLTEVAEDDLETYAEDPLKALYIPSLSGLDVHEPEYGAKVLATRLAHGKGGTVVRNMVNATSQNEEKWQALQATLQAFFGYELSKPTGADPIMVRYRHAPEERWYDLIDGAAGFLQTVLLQAALLHSDATLFLIDEPDAHLHALLKEKVYRLVREHCQNHRCQAVIATHSGRLIEEAARESGEKLLLITQDGLKPVRQQEAKELSKIPTEQIVHAETMQRVLYLEGKSDLDILREWASVLDHPATRCLEGVFWVATAEEGGQKFIQRHFRALKAQVPTLLGLEVRDRDEREETTAGQLEPGKLVVEAKKLPDDMKQVFWNRYEIENYLIHPQAILRLLSRRLDPQAVQKARDYMQDYLPPVIFEKPFEKTATDRTKGKATIAEIFTAAGSEINASEYYRIAGEMKKDEVHPDVVAMLDLIEDQLT